MATVVDRWVMARRHWENDPDLSYSDVARMMGVTPQGARKRILREGWAKQFTAEELAERAQAAAAEPELVPALDPDPDAEVHENPPQPIPHARVPPRVERRVDDVELPELTTPATVGEALQGAAVGARAEIVTRHRQEWQVARGKVYAGIKANDEKKVKLGKAAAEAMKIIQEGERKSWGLDATDARTGKDAPTSKITETRI